MGQYPVGAALIANSLPLKLQDHGRGASVV